MIAPPGPPPPIGKPLSGAPPRDAKMLWTVTAGAVALLVGRKFIDPTAFEVTLQFNEFWLLDELVPGVMVRDKEAKTDVEAEIAESKVVVASLVVVENVVVEEEEVVVVVVLARWAISSPRDLDFFLGALSECLFWWANFDCSGTTSGPATWVLPLVR